MIRVAQTATTTTDMLMYFPYNIKNNGRVSSIGVMKFGLNLRTMFNLITTLMMYP